ncbi:hypothetical protein BpHYR1_007206 [Brachionus plicatilis]|uniref:Uncharacterized protein n=1 Tax=Brachionus plicatilis TaxID=10195 RepID=A0A3M7SQQ9_BRAPC|nr:hypothetical protein BpHYR1_007206 [Brachionus plicatilis]
MDLIFCGFGKKKRHTISHCLKNLQVYKLPEIKCNMIFLRYVALHCRAIFVSFLVFIKIRIFKNFKYGNKIDMTCQLLT